MVRASNFAEFVAQLSADDKELQKDLKSAETATKASATRMQGSLNKVNISAGSLSGALGTVSQAGAAAGGSIGGIVGQSVAATQALAGLLAVITGPASLIIGLAALGVGVVAFREEMGGWLNDLGESIGLLEDLGEALAKAEGRLATQEARLKKQTDAEARLNIELKERQKLLSATRTGSPENVAQATREIALQRRIRQERAAGSGEKAIKVLTDIFDKDTKILETRKKQADFAKRTAASQKETADALAEQERRQKSILTLQQGRVQAAQQLLISLGAKPSEFIDDPVLKRLAALGESLQGGQQAPPGVQGSFGLRRISGPGGALKEGQTIGNQQLSTAEKNTKINADTLVVIQRIRTILDTATGTSSGVGGTAPLQLTGRP